MNIFAMTVCCVAFIGAGETSPLKVAPKLIVGQEVSYTGTITRTTVGSAGARFEQPFEISASMLVLNTAATKVADVGAYTVIRLPDFRPTKEKTAFENIHSINFSLVNVAPGGKANWSGNEAEIELPQDGWAPWELGYLIEAPKEPIQIGGTWIIRKAGQPHMIWKAVKNERIVDTECLKLTCEQQSQNWTAKNVTLAAWRNDVTVWVDREKGFVQRLHREYHIRHPGSETGTETITVKYDQASNLRYVGPILQERVNDFKAALVAQQEIEKGVVTLAQQGKSPFPAIRDRLQYVMESTYTTPYRPAIKRMYELAKRACDDPHSVVLEEVGGTLGGEREAQIGLKARSFVVRGIDSDEPITLKKLAGKTVVMVFVDPTSDLSTRTLSRVLEIVSEQKNLVEVLAVSTDGTPEGVNKLKAAVEGKYTICTGQGLEKSYGVKGAPHTLFIDSDGILRGNFVGLGPEMDVELTAGLARFAGPVETIHRKPKPTFLR